MENLADKRLKIDNFDLAQEFQETTQTKLMGYNVDTTQILMLDESDNIDDSDKDLFGEDEEEEDDGAKSMLSENRHPDINESEFNKKSINEPNMNEDEDFFCEMNDMSVEERKYVNEKSTSDEITEDMFGMSDDEDNTREIMGNTVTENPENESSLGNKNKMENKRLNLKCKYLDIPLEELTLSNNPLYTDPGAPLPVETSRDKRKSVFAPLTFNPIIESNVDNKYKNGGKFSFSPTQRDETLNFDISAGNISSSEDEDDEDDESESSFESIEYNNIKQELKLFDNSVHGTQFLNYQPIIGVQESVPPSLISGGNSLSSESYARDPSNTIWKLSHSNNGGDLLPIKGGDSYFAMTTDH